MPGGRVETETVQVGEVDGQALLADLYVPPEPNGCGVLLVHGGAWVQGDREQLRGYGILLGRIGYTCLACEYRLAPGAQWPAQIDDVNTALRYFHQRAAGLGIDPAPATPGDELLSGRAPPRGDADRGEGAEFQPAEPVTGGRTQHGKLAVQCWREPVSGVIAIIGSLDRRRQQTHDVCVAGGDPQHPWPAGADEQARAAPGLGHHVKRQPVGVVPGAGVIHPVAGQQSGDDRERLLEPLDPLAGPSNAIPAARYSGWYQPAPMPSSKRPPDR